jgi:hypothetical protein
MDPKIAAGFNILGNALMPDPRALATAEVMRSQMLQNQAQTGKLTAETDALKRTAENLALLQDILSTGRASAGDIISRGVGAGLTTNPAQIPQFALGTIGTQGLTNLDDPDAFSKALLATGTVAGQAQTPVGFGQDQARQAAEAAAKDLTEQRGQNIESTDRRYDTDVDRATDLDVAGLDADTKLEIADITRSTSLLMNARDNARAKLVAAQDRAQRTNDNRETLAAQAELSELDRQAKALQDRLTRIQLTQSQRLQRDADLEEVRIQQEGAGARSTYTTDTDRQTKLDVAASQAASAAEVARIREGGGAGDVPDISPEAYRNFRGNVADALKNIDPDSVIYAPNGKDIEKVKGLNEDDWLALSKAAFQLYPKNDPQRTKFVTDVLKNKHGRWRFNKKVFDAYTMGEGDEEEPNPAVTGDTGIGTALTPEIPDTSTPAPYKDIEGVEIWPLNGVWVRADGTPAKE